MRRCIWLLVTLIFLLAGVAPAAMADGTVRVYYAGPEAGGVRAALDLARATVVTTLVVRCE